MCSIQQHKGPYEWNIACLSRCIPGTWWSTNTQPLTVEECVHWTLYKTPFNLPLSLPHSHTDRQWPGNMPARPTVFLYRALHTLDTAEAHSVWCSDLNCPHCQTQHISAERCKEIPSPSIPNNTSQSCLHISAQTLLSVSAAEGRDWRLALAPQSKR